MQPHPSVNVTLNFSFNREFKIHFIMANTCTSNATVDIIIPITFNFTILTLSKGSEKDILEMVRTGIFIDFYSTLMTLPITIPVLS